MGTNLVDDSLDTVERLFTPKSTIRVFTEGMVFEATPIAPLTKTHLSEDLKSDPSLLTIFSYLFRLKPLMSFESLSNALTGAIRMALRDIEAEYNQQDLLASIISALTLEQLTTLTLTGISITVREESSCCWAIKPMGSFVMEIHDERVHRWKFPPCILGIPLYGPCEMELTVYALEPCQYVHPFLVDGNAICMGSFADSQSLEKIAQMPDLVSKMTNLFAYAEQIIVSGYRIHRDVEPAISIFDSIFNKYRLK